MFCSSSFGAVTALACAVLLFCPPTAADDDPFADVIVQYEPGTNPVAGYINPGASLGEPTRFTGGIFDPMVVSMLNPAWRPEEVVSIGEGGWLTVMFNTPVTDDPHNPYGIDLIIFGNAFFSSDEPPGNTIASPATITTECGQIEISVDGITWYSVTGCADGLFPTEGYADVVNPYATTQGNVNADFTKPLDPSLALSDFDGLVYAAARDLYRGSGGGLGIDIAEVGLAAISYVRISNPENPSDTTPEIDAIADVTPRRPGDLTGDGVVNIEDIFALLGAWGSASPDGWHAEMTGDTVIDIEDVFAVLGLWGG